MNTEPIPTPDRPRQISPALHPEYGPGLIRQRVPDQWWGPHTHDFARVARLSQDDVAALVAGEASLVAVRDDVTRMERLSEMHSRTRDRVVGRIEKLRAELEAEAEAAEEAVRAAIRPTDSAAAREVRSAIRSLPPAERADAARRLARADLEALKSVASSPALLTGLPEQDHADLYRRAVDYSASAHELWAQAARRALEVLELHRQGAERSVLKPIEERLKKAAPMLAQAKRAREDQARASAQLSAP